MNDFSPVSWGQVALYFGGAVSVVVVSVGHLFKTMGAGYGGIIAALQAQNAKQQAEIEELAKRLDVSDAKCDRRIAELEKQHAANRADINHLQEVARG